MPNNANPTQGSSDKMAGFRKHQQVAQTNRHIFGWVVMASVVVAICVVLIQFLVQHLIFNYKVIGKKTETNTTLVRNIDAASELKKKIDALITNTNLQKVASSNQSASTTNNLQIVLDALPTDNDGETFANSLATVVLPRANIKVTNLTAGLQAGSAETTASTDGAVGTTPFSFTIEGSYKDIEATLENITKVIRPIKIDSINLRVSSADTMVATVEGVTYYLPASSVDLGTVEVKP